jgi:hypothetical protein
MSAAAILSVAARKAASEGKKVGAAALTLIALVVMSFTAFPGLTRPSVDQMAGAPTSQGSESETSQATDQSANQGSESSSAGDQTEIDPAPEEASSEGSASRRSPTPTPSTDAIERVLTEPTLGGIMNSDSKSTLFVLDQDYTAVGQNGLTAKFTFNPTRELVFSKVTAEISLENMTFGFTPSNSGILKSKTSEGLDLYIFSGQAAYLFDAAGNRWTETTSTNARFIIQVIMDKNGSTVKEVILSLNSAD